MPKQAIATFLAAAVLTSAGGIAGAQDSGIGKASYDRYCAVCHGETGRGDGPVAQLFAEQPRNLRTLSAENNKAFPFSEVYQSINGRRNIEAHGTSEMPIWGDIFVAEALPPAVHSAEEAEQIVQGRILALVYYLQSIQD